MQVNEGNLCLYFIQIILKSHYKKLNSLIKSLLLGLTALFICSFSAFSQSGLTFEVPLQKQVQSSTLIIEGKVIDKKSVWNSSNSLIYTINTIEVYKSFKGKTQNTIEIITLGGRIGDEILDVHPALKIKKDALGIFMLQKSSVDLSQGSALLKTFYEVVSATQGFYKYNLSDNKAFNPYATFEGISKNLYHKIQHYSQEKAIEKRFFDVDQAIVDKNKSLYKSASLTINSISPLEASAGTKTVLTISGNGFGSTKGEVFFLNANDGGDTYENVPPADILTWNDGKIEVYIPTHAGSGNILIEDANSVTQQSTEALSISYAIFNAFDGQENYLPNLLDIDGNGGYVWQMTTNFEANTLAKSAFNRAINSWTCSTSVNWKTGANTEINTTERDGINVVRFDENDELPLGLLGQCFNYYLVCQEDEAAVTESDILVNNQVNWNYGPEAPANNQFDFESVILHELGHALQLSHVLEVNDIMYFQSRNGVANRTLSDHEEAGSAWVIENSSETCSFEPMTAVPCLDSDDDGIADNQDQCAGTSAGQMVNEAGCSATQLLSVADEKLDESIRFYPNPTSTKFSIKSQGILIEKVEIYSVLGVKVAEINSGFDQIQMGQFLKGIYVVKISSEKGTATRRLFKI